MARPAGISAVAKSTEAESTLTPSAGHTVGLARFAESLKPETTGESEESQSLASGDYLGSIAQRLDRAEVATAE